MERFFGRIPLKIYCMKKILLTAGLAASLMACNNDGKETTVNTTTDSAGHNAHKTEMPTDTSGMAGKSMMSAMQNMMDNMKTMQSSGNPDNDFASMMKAHHIGAIEMAQMEVAKGTDAQVKQMAQKMIDDQQREVAELNTFLAGHSAHGGGDAFHKEAMRIMNNMKMDADHAGSIDKQFVQMMIPHHQSAIDMASAYLKNGAHEQKLKTMANNIISAQQKEIAELKGWLDGHK
jgi:uncharacterized protein (DUF305 family)